LTRVAAAVALAVIK